MNLKFWQLFKKKKVNPDIIIPRKELSKGKIPEFIDLGIGAIQTMNRHYPIDLVYLQDNGYTSMISLSCSMNHINYVFNIPKPVCRIGSKHSQIDTIRCLVCSERVKGGEVYINGEKILKEIK